MTHPKQAMGRNRFVILSLRKNSVDGSKSSLPMPKSALMFTLAADCVRCPKPA